MLSKSPLLLVAALLLSACQTPAPTQAKVVTYSCDDGRTVQAMYPDTTTAILTVAGVTHRLHTAISADGARYVGGPWQWWTKGLHDARLAPLSPSQSMAGTSGVSCRAP